MTRPNKWRASTKLETREDSSSSHWSGGLPSLPNIATVYHRVVLQITPNHYVTKKPFPGKKDFHYLRLCLFLECDCLHPAKLIVNCSSTSSMKSQQLTIGSFWGQASFQGLCKARWWLSHTVEYNTGQQRSIFLHNLGLCSHYLATAETYHTQLLTTKSASCLLCFPITNDIWESLSML